MKSLTREEEILEELQKKFPKAVKEGKVQRERRLWVTVERDSLLEVCRHLRDEMGYGHLSSVVGVDYPENFEVVYHLWSYEEKIMVSLKVPLPKDDPRVESVTGVWGAANWHERETGELFGITFEGHPYPKRLLLADDFEGYPFRKDFKLEAKPWYGVEEEAKEGGGDKP